MASPERDAPRSGTFVAARRIGQFFPGARRAARQIQRTGVLRYVNARMAPGFCFELLSVAR